MKPHEAERIANALAIGHAQMRAFFITRDVLPSFLYEAWMQRLGQLTNGDLGVLCMELFYLYDKCAQAGLIEQSAIEAEYLADMRRTLKEMKQQGIDVTKLRTSEVRDVLKELHEIIGAVRESYNAGRTKQPTAEEVISKARGETT